MRAGARPWLSAALAGTVLVVLAWRPLLLGGQVPVDGNMLALSYPNWSLGRSLWKSPRLPLWNPLRNMGEPHLADPQTMALYPPFAALSSLPDFPSFLRLWVVLHTVLAAAFLWLLARRWYADPAAAAAAAALAGLNGFLTSRVTFPNHFAAAAWLPPLLYFQAAGSWKGLGVCLALQWLAGFPPFVAVSAVAVLALACSQGTGGLRCFLKGCLLGIGLSAVQWVPFLELLASSTRALTVDPLIAVQYSLPPGELAKELLAPQWYAWSPSMSGDPAIQGFYAGLLALALAIVGVRRGGRRERIVALAAAAGLVLSLGASLPGYASLAPLRLFRFPANWLLMPASLAGLLCAAGIAKLSPRWRWTAAAAVAVDLALFAQFPRSAWAIPGLLTDPPALAAAVASGPTPSRILHTRRLMTAWMAGTLQEEEDYLLMRDFLAPSFGTAFGVQEVFSYQTLRLKAADAYQKRLGAAPAPDLLAWAGVSTVVTLAETATRVRRSDLRVRRAAGPRPRVFLQPDRCGRASLASYAPGRARVAVAADQDCGLVFSEMDYPGWRAAVDGRPSPHARFQDAFILVEVPKGEHEVVLDFSPASWRLGLALSVLAAGLLLAI
ncbi:MAG: YfhO family protein [Elusimicrobia bacterium]|nr:YfhO family protein [Elusimicrobiota bacterium]